MKISRFFLSLGILVSAALLISACANVEAQGDSDNPYATADVNDPWEGMNRAIFSFNEVVDNILLKPVAHGYRFIVPEPGRKMVRNFLSNLNSPVIFLNSVLQGDPQNAFSTLWRFILNSTFGVGGLFDFAGANTDLKHRPEDFGQTMGVWGAGSGPYLVLPILGPSSGRDAVGKVVDIVSDPITYMDEEIVWTRAGMVAVSSREELLDVVDDIYRTSLDPYATIRSAYLQRREAEVNNRGMKKKDTTLTINVQ